jgi:hypothetical protein
MFAEQLRPECWTVCLLDASELEIACLLLDLASSRCAGAEVRAAAASNTLFRTNSWLVQS